MGLKNLNQVKGRQREFFFKNALPHQRVCSIAQNVSATGEQLLIHFAQW